MKQLLAFALALFTASAFAQVEVEPSLNESVRMVPKRGALYTFELETTIYKPDGDGPFPIALINHGKAFGDPRFQARYRPLQAARYFLQRGYAVVAPMRQGFSRSGGSYVGGGCNVESNGRTQAEDVRAVLDWLRSQPWADASRTVVLGQSHGGWTTLAFGSENYPGVRALVNFAGGLRQENCVDWKGNLVASAASYGRSTRVPSLWFYGDNDSYFDPDTFRPMLQRYATAGGNARMIAFGKFGSDAHSMFGSRTGNAIWQPEVSRFLASVGLPHEVRNEFARYGVLTGIDLPPRTDWAPLDDESRVPHLRDSGRAGYRAYLARPVPRAFAVAPGGAWAWADGGVDPFKRALDHCNRSGRGACQLYSVDDYVVWKEPR